MAVAFNRHTDALSSQVTRLRKAQGWSVDELATRTGISKALLYRIENGKHSNPTLERLLRLQWVFDLDTLETLLGEIPSANAAGVDKRLPR
jgi:transcriptional regulator with XRE-family HTH domain